MFQRFALILLATATWSGGWPDPSSAAAPPTAPRFALLGNDEAWQRLPRANPPLPSWARMLAASMPRTTASMLRLDFLHRAQNPLGPVLAGKLRWTAADAIRCDYAKRTAAADLRRAGLTERELKSLTDPRYLPAAERAALLFARKLTLAGHSVTDTEFAGLLEHFGAEKVVAMVHTLAYANFQNRIFLALQVEVEPGGPVPPIDFPIDPRRAKGAAPARPPWGKTKQANPSSRATAPAAWDGRTFADLRESLEHQKARKGRIPLPSSERLARIPPEAKGQASRVVWTNVSMGYQPMMTKTWFEAMQPFREESGLDRVFANTLFWVITRSNECFY
jgi:alkylhydroperoxidase family enzyme